MIQEWMAGETEDSLCIIAALSDNHLEIEP